MMFQVGDDGVVSSVNEEDLIYVDKNELDKFVESYHELEKENEELKSTIKKLEAQLYCNHDDGVCSICKHCYLEEQSLYYISKCEKGHEQCSRVNVKYCDDFEIKE